jgi:versiconal hemiacetal acetate esterase
LHGHIDDIFKGWEAIGAGMVAKFSQYFAPPDETVKTEDKKIDNGLTVRIYTPSGYNGGMPVFVYIHAGGWAMGDLDMDDAPCRVISKGAGVIVVSVDYRLAPVHKYPAGLDDCVTAYKWALGNAKALNCVPNQGIIGGASAGGGSTFGLALRLIDDGLGSTTKGLVSQIPVTVHPDAVPSELKSRYTSYKEHAEHTVNTESAMRGFFGIKFLPLVPFNC